jgi:hypothetical protein
VDFPVIRQCLSFLPLQDFVSPVLDYRTHKLTAAKLIKIFVSAQLLQWPSLSYISDTIRAESTLQQEFELSSIHKSQLSRSINQLPVEVTEALFRSVVQQVCSHLPSRTEGMLALIDSTNIHLPFHLADWTKVTKHRSGIKVHTRLMIINKDTAYPDKIVPSLGKISDYEGSDELVVDSDVTYVMDRGYVCYKRMQRWAADKLSFVIRVSNHHHAEVQEERPLDPQTPHILRDAIVIMGKNAKTTMKEPLRLVEFQDSQGRFYRLATTLWDLSAAEVAEIYRQRWLIELFFKWMKQHLKMARLYSHQPEAVWNHVFLALVAYGLTFLMKQETGTKKNMWSLLQLVRVYALKGWKAFQEEMKREPSRTSAGRRKREGPAPSRKVRASEVVMGKRTKQEKVKTK